MLWEGWSGQKRQREAGWAHHFMGYVKTAKSAKKILVCVGEICYNDMRTCYQQNLLCRLRTPYARQARAGNNNVKRGERMSLEAISKIRAVEEGMERSKADAKAQAQKLVADAEREGRALLQQGKEKAAAAAAAAMKQAEGQAEERRKEILAQAEKDCEKLKKDARTRMDKAAQAILGRVVES